MGAIWFREAEFVASLSEIVGFKTGLAGLWALIGEGCCGTSRNPPTSSPQWQASSPSTRSVRSLEVAF